VAEDGPEPARGDAATPLFRGVRWSIAVLLLAAAAFVASSLVTWAYHLVAGQTEAAEEETTVRSGRAVVRAVRDLARLQTASYHVQQVIDLQDKQSTLFGLLETKDAILLVAAADVTAGVDLSQLGDGDVHVDSGSGNVRITLPPPEVFSTRLDTDRTYVHSRETDLLARRNEQLESKARSKAERRLRQAALEAGLLDRARRNARRTVTALARSMGHEKVRVTFADGD
jgi:hypothetical protein